MRGEEEKGEGGVGSEKRLEYPEYPAAGPEYPAAGPEYPDSPEYPGPGPETPAPPETEQKDVQKIDLV